MIDLTADPYDEMDATGAQSQDSDDAPPLQARLLQALGRPPPAAAGRLAAAADGAAVVERRPAATPPGATAGGKARTGAAAPCEIVISDDDGGDQEEPRLLPGALAAPEESLQQRRRQRSPSPPPADPHGDGLGDWCLQPLQRRIGGRGRGAARAQPAGGVHGGAGGLRPDGSAEQQQAGGSSGAVLPPEGIPQRPLAAAAAAAVADSGPSRKRLQADPDSSSSSQGAAPGAGSGGGAAAAAAAAAKKPRLAAGERASQKAEEKARKQAEKIAAKLARQAEAEAAKAAKRFNSFLAKKQGGSLQELEVVMVMDAATAASALGLALAAELDRRRTVAWQVVERLPLSGRWPGCACFCFRRRKLSQQDEHAAKTAVSTRLESFVEDAPPPYLQLVFQQPGALLDELARDRMAALLAAVAAAHPGFTLGLLVLGLKGHVQRTENQQMRQGVATALSWRRVQQQLLELHVGTPGLQLRTLPTPEDAAQHLVHTARALSHQPYSAETQLEACGGAGPGAASKAAAGAIAEDLGPLARAFAVNTLGKMSGMGGTKAWAVARAYPSLGSLICGFQRAAAAPGAQAPLLLADLLEPEAAGKARPRRVGPAMSRRLHLLLTSTDPDAIVEGGGDSDADPDAE